MPATLTYPGVYIEEISSGVHTITGVATSISGVGNSGLSGQASGGAGYARRNSSLVGARLLRQEMGAKNCRDHRETRRTRFPRRKAVSRWPDILPRLSAISLHAAATVDTTLYSYRN